MLSASVDETTISRVALPTDARYELDRKLHEKDVRYLQGKTWVSDTVASFLIFYGQGIYDPVSIHTGIYVFPSYVNKSLEAKNGNWRKLQRLIGSRDEGSDNEKRKRLSEIKSLSQKIANLQKCYGNLCRGSQKVIIPFNQDRQHFGVSCYTS